MATYGKIYVAVFALIVACVRLTTSMLLDSVCYEDPESLYDVALTENLSLDDYRGRVVLIVNTASFCQYTYQYPDLNKLEEMFGDSLAILGFPCNQFWLQEPGVGQEILHTLKYVRPGHGYEPNFYLHYEKIDVNGPTAHPLFDRLKRACPPVKSEIGDPAHLYWSPMTIGDITWNFNKFLLDKEGYPYKRYDSAVEPLQLEADIELILNGQHERVVERPSRPKYANV